MMQLTFESQIINQVAVIRCKGRITFGPEAEALEKEVERQTKIEGTSVYVVKRVLLQLGEVDFIDSSGLGALVRLSKLIHAAGGELKLCQASDKVLRVIEITHLGSLFPTYKSEAEAIDAFSSAARNQDTRPEPLKIRIVCVDTSKDLLAGLNALLSRAGYEVLTTLYISEAATLTRATNPRVLICGPGVTSVPTAAAILDALRGSSGDLEILQLPSDYHTADAGQAGESLLSKLQALAQVN